MVVRALCKATSGSADDVLGAAKVVGTDEIPSSRPQRLSQWSLRRSAVVSPVFSAPRPGGSMADSMAVFGGGS